ncbi:Ig-like domain-containing protein [Flavobacterium caeni]|uniref:SbsA Ig-like domain-containing protein n=1 Tax=Flavobacterium caeni TaxID=490189 RepID=A0A1G5FP86_9FLAO|nr:Ig-like domain-containing protein [Flavobacterium caeni]SCY41043.1 hypothetical protein SAMN02927903_01358 [Flavobacterium caeni]
MKNQLLLLASFALVFAGCSSDEETMPTPAAPEAATYKIINNGNGGVTTVSDEADAASLQIAQAIPSVSGRVYPSNMPIVFFLDDKILLSSITTESFIVKENNVAKGGTISVNEASNGFAIFTFTPKHAFKPNAAIDIILTTDLKDDGGNGFDQQVSYNYTTSALQPASFDTNGGFENGADGVNFIGDGNIMTSPQGCMAPFEGSNFGAISTGDHLISADDAIGGASSVMIVGPIAEPVSSITFNYNFLSAEFQEYVGSVYDDSFVVIVYGDDGAYTEMVNSVNLIGLDGNTQCTGFPGMADAGDEYYGATGWLNKTMSFPSVGANAHVIFIATDVTDQIFSTIVGVDDVSFGN